MSEETEGLLRLCVSGSSDYSLLNPLTFDRSFWNDKISHKHEQSDSTQSSMNWSTKKNAGKESNEERRAAPFVLQWWWRAMWSPLFRDWPEELAIRSAASFSFYY